MRSSPNANALQDIWGAVKVLWLRMQDIDPCFREGRHFAGVMPPIQCLVMPAAAGIHLC